MHYYTYAYLREDKTPYYIGKGKEDRIYKTTGRNIKPPKDKSRIIFLKKNLTEEEAFKHEIYMIDVFGRIDLGTGILHNKTNGGDGVSGWVPSEETKIKMGEAQKGRTHSEETKIKMSEAKKGNIILEETKIKMSEAKKGKTHSQETKIKMSESHKGENHHFYGKTLSEEHRRKMSEANKGKTLSEEHRRKMSEAMEGEKNPNFGKKWWNDGCGNRKMMIECPGDGWKLGRK